MGINMDEIYNVTWEHYQSALDGLLLAKSQFVLEHTAISDTIPGFCANKLKFGSYNKANYAVLFVDMRGSTARAVNVGAQKTFLTMHVFLPALLEVVNYYDGKVVDIMGDGIMVFWGGEGSSLTNAQAIQNAGQCAWDMLRVRTGVINKIIVQEQLGPEISIGIGVTFDNVVVTKIGIADTYDVKAFGDCINKASKYSKYMNKIKVSKKVRDTWPSGHGGTLHFVEDKKEGGYFIESKA